jgi:hypothetical protein
VFLRGDRRGFDRISIRTRLLRHAPATEVHSFDHDSGKRAERVIFSDTCHMTAAAKPAWTSKAAKRPAQVHCYIRTDFEHSAVSMVGKQPDQETPSTDIPCQPADSPEVDMSCHEAARQSDIVTYMLSPLHPQFLHSSPRYGRPAPAGGQQTTWAKAAADLELVGSLGATAKPLKLILLALFGLARPSPT